MLHCVTFLLLLAQPAPGGEQIQRIEGDTAEKLTATFGVALTKSTAEAPIKVTLDLKRGSGWSSRDIFALVVPDSQLNAKGLAKLGPEPISIGVLFMHKITLLEATEPLPRDRHRMLEVKVGNTETSVAAMHLAVGKAAGLPVLLVYTDKKTPTVVTTLVEIATSNDQPLDVEVMPLKDSRALLVVTVAGRYRAALILAPLD